MSFSVSLKKPGFNHGGMALAEQKQQYGFEDLTVVMPTYNEEQSIEYVINDIRKTTDGTSNVICVDSSTDKTTELAREQGARVIEQEPKGYGAALKIALHEADTPVVLTTDCDDTYPMECIPDFLNHINKGYDVVSGDRISGGAETMPTLNRFGNHVFAVTASVLTGTRIHDTTTGMRMYRKEVLQDIEWTENTGLSAELLLRPLMRGYDIKEVKIPYRERRGESKLNPWSGGLAITKSILKVCLEERLRPL